MKRIRILHVLGGLNRGGAETWFIQLLRRLSKERYQVDVLVFTDDVGAYEREALSLGARVLRTSPPSTGIRFFRQFQRAVREYGPYDVVHSHVWLATGLVMFASWTTKTPRRVAHSRTTSDRNSQSAHRKLYEFAMRAAIDRYATHLVGITHAAGSSLFRSNRWENEGLVIPTALDCSPFQHAVDRNQVRSELGIPLNARVVGHVGRFTQAKNHEFVIDVFEALAKRLPDAHLLLVGDGPNREDIKRQVEASRLQSRVTFAGLRDDVARLMLGGMDVFLFPSSWEGLGRVVVEAQAAGLPSVISDVVPHDADVVPGLVNRVSLRQPPETWVAAIISCLKHPLPVSRLDALRAVQASDLNIDNTLRILDKLYSA